MFEPNPFPLDCCHRIPFENCQSELARPVKNHICDIHGLVLPVWCSGDVGKIKKFLDGGEYGRDWVSSIVDRLLDGVFALKELVGPQLTAVVLEVIQHVRHGVVDWIGRAVADIHKVRVLERGNNLLHGSLLHSRHLSEQTHFLGVCDSHAGIRVGSCAVRDDERTRVSRVDEGSGWYERVLRISGQ